MKTVKCVKLNKELAALDRAPYPGDLGGMILKNISKEAWADWLNYQTMLINENNLNLLDDTTQQYLKKQMKNFLFGGKVDEIKGFIDE